MKKMQNVFIIEGGQEFAHSGGTFNKSVTSWSEEILKQNGFNVRTTHVREEYNTAEEVENYKWADIIIYHFPVWWFQVPFRLKQYIDEVFTVGHNNGMYKSDGRSRVNPEINYGTGGLMQGKKYFVTSSWNAPETAFTLENEFFDQKSVDEGVLFGFHKMNKFTGLTCAGSFHFHDMEKNASEERIQKYKEDYQTKLIDSLS